MWKPRLESVATQGRNVVATVSFTNGDERIVETIPGNDLTAARLGEFCKRVIAQLDIRDAAFADLKALSGQDVVIPNDDEAAKAASVFFELRAKSASVNQAIVEGYSKDQESADALSVEVKSLFLPEYTTDFRWK